MAQIVAEVRRCVEQGYVDMAQPLQPNAWPTVTGNPGSPRTVQCGPLTLLLYADDLLIVAQNKDHLDLAMRAATKAVHLMGGKFNRAKTRHLVTSLSAVSQRWYEVNTAGELEVAGECPKATRLSKQTGDAYLGTTVTHTADMRPQALAAHKATRANLSRVGSIASTYGRHDPGITKIVLHQAYSYLLFGAEVWATKHDALHNGTLQAVAHTAARALDLPRRTSRAFLLGELGLRAPRTALFGAKIMYWAELLIQPDHRFQRHCYKMDLATFVAGEARGDRWPTWCSELHAMLQHISTTIQRLPPGARPASVRWLLDGWADADVAAQHEQLTLAVQRMGLPSLPARCDLHNVEAYCAARRTVRQLASHAWENYCLGACTDSDDPSTVPVSARERNATNLQLAATTKIHAGVASRTRHSAACTTTCSNGDGRPHASAARRVAGWAAEVARPLGRAVVVHVGMHRHGVVAGKVEHVVAHQLAVRAAWLCAQAGRAVVGGEVIRREQLRHVVVLGRLLSSLRTGKSAIQSHS